MPDGPPFEEEFPMENLPTVPNFFRAVCENRSFRRRFFVPQVNHITFGSSEIGIWNPLHITAGLMNLVQNKFFAGRILGPHTRPPPRLPPNSLPHRGRIVRGDVWEGNCEVSTCAPLCSGGDG